LHILKYVFLCFACLLYCAVFVSVYQKSDVNTLNRDLDLLSGQLIETANILDNTAIQRRNITLLGYKINYIIKPEDICSSKGDNDSVLLMIVVHSAVGNRAQRDAIRNTWYRTIHHFTDVRIILIFLVGSDQDQGLMTNVVAEGTVYRDLVVFDMIDTYRNLSLKSLLGLHWVNEFCAETRFVLKVDDDVYVNLRTIIINLLYTGSISENISQPDIKRNNRINTLCESFAEIKYNLSFVKGHGLVGAVNRKSRVMRYGLWGIEHKEHPEEFYPDYCSGNMYLLNITVVELLLKASYLYHDSSSVPVNENNSVSLSQQMRFVPFEDVFVTGYLARNIGVTCYHHRGFPHWSDGVNKANIVRLVKGQLLAIHNVYYLQMYRIYKLIGG